MENYTILISIIYCTLYIIYNHLITWKSANQGYMGFLVFYKVILIKIHELEHYVLNLSFKRNQYRCVK
jgi:uncharacterized membrane protein YagU involved in acid resistance